VACLKPRQTAVPSDQESNPRLAADAKVGKSSLWNSPLQLEPPPHTPVPDIHWIAKHERTTSDNAFHSKELALADSIFRDTAFSKGTMKPYSRYAALLALANDRCGDSGMGGNHNTVNVAGYRYDARVTLYALDTFGVGIDGKHFVPAIPKFLEHGIGSDVRMSRNACYCKALSLKESCN
jgi:hypothetical protein